METMKSKEPNETTRKPSRPINPRPQLSIAPEKLAGQIATRAHEIYVRRISQGALDDWLEAEREILGKQNKRSSATPIRGGYAAQDQD
jgi:hypothetical protein